MDAGATVAQPNGPSTEEYGFAWFILVLVIVGLFAFDATFLEGPLSVGRVSFKSAVKLTLFWITTGLVFDLFLFGYLGTDEGVGFLQGYLLEYILSFDNLFVFHLVFAYYCTPEALMYRALCYGILGAIVLRVAFFFVGFECMASGVYVVKLLFGGVLIYSGIKSVNAMDEDEDTHDPTNSMFVSFVTKHLPVSDTYEPHGKFFITVAEVEALPPRSASTSWHQDVGGIGVEEDAPRADSFEAPSSGLPRLESFEGSSLLDPQRAGGAPTRAADESPPAQGWLRQRHNDSFEVVRKPAKPKRKASLLLLVIIVVWFVDLVFAVDSVASKTALVKDVFLNCSSSAFAMLSLRSLYFVMESLVEMFQMVKYGIAAILILIGLKLIFADQLDITYSVCFAIIVAVLVASIASSYWMPRARENCERIDLGNMGTITEAGEEEYALDDFGQGGARGRIPPPAPAQFDRSQAPPLGEPPTGGLHLAAHSMSVDSSSRLLAEEGSPQAEDDARYE